MKLPTLMTGAIHFIGIGGIGMSGIAILLHRLGYQVQGSDLTESAQIQRLRDQGISVHIGHSSLNLTDAQVVVISSAVKPDNPELQEARRRQLPVVKRAEMLAELMRHQWSIGVAGAHGKTTTTSLIAAVLETAHKDPTVVNGGIINSYGSNARLGNGSWLVAETDESDGSFLHLPITIAVVTNIDPEHMEFYGTFENLEHAFATFISHTPFYGLAILGIDSEPVYRLSKTIQDRRILTYGIHPEAQIRVYNIRPQNNGYIYDIELNTPNLSHQKWTDVYLPMVGRHNVINSLAAIAVGLELAIDESTIRQSLFKFEGVKRRFTITGIPHGITVVDDYGHHPTEIKAVLSAAKDVCKGRIIAIIQPHRYTRLHDLFNEFCTCTTEADTVIVLPLYSAGEPPIAGINSETLAEGIKHHGHPDTFYLADPTLLAETLHPLVQAGDYIICLGAGTITQMAHKLPQELEEIVTTPTPLLQQQV